MGQKKVLNPSDKRSIFNEDFKTSPWRCCVACSCSEPVSAPVSCCLWEQWAGCQQILASLRCTDSFEDAENVCVSHVKAGAGPRILSSRIWACASSLRARDWMNARRRFCSFYSVWTNQRTENASIDQSEAGGSFIKVSSSRCNNQGCVKLRAKIASLCIVQCGMEREDQFSWDILNSDYLFLE